MYVIIKIRFDIAFAVFIVSQFANNSGFKHIAIIKPIFWYCKKYCSLGIIYKQGKSLSLYGYIDLDQVIDSIT